MTSAQFWLGPGASTFFSSAANLEALAALIMSLLGGHVANQAGLATAWQGPSGAASQLSHLPYQAWLAEIAPMLTVAGAQIAATGEAFEMFKAATATPVEVTENQTEHVVLNANNILGVLTGLIIANRFEYFRKWTTGAANMYGYLGASTAGVQSIPPIPPPTPSGMPTSPDLSSVSDLAAEKPLEKFAESAQAPQQMMSSIMPMFSQLASLPMQSTGMLSGVTQMPQQMLQPLMSMMGQFGSMGADTSGLDAVTGSAPWVTSTPSANGPVSANLSGPGGPGALSSLGATSPVSSVRGPVSWSSAVAAASGVPESTVSRVAEARTATTVPASSSMMGAPGAMMGPMAHAAQRGSDGDNQQQGEISPLATVAQLYREPTDLPVITGGAGEQYVTGEEER